MTALLILLRHGQSEWNAQNRFTGFVDVDLSPKGQEEARKAGQFLAKFHIDALFCSVLKRAIHTAEIALDGRIPPIYIKDASLNERHYGDLQGKNKAECQALYGEEQVHQWRRSFSIKPPGGESLKDTYGRVIAFYLAAIEPLLKLGQTVLIVAHGNSLRALLMYLENITEENISSIEIPTARPIVYEMSAEGTMLRKDVAETLRE